MGSGEAIKHRGMVVLITVAQEVLNHVDKFHLST